MDTVLHNRRDENRNFQRVFVLLILVLSTFDTIYISTPSRSHRNLTDTYANLVNLGTLLDAF